VAANPLAVRRQQAIALRRTDRRRFADVDVPVALLVGLRTTAESEGVHLHLLDPDDVITLAVGADPAAAVRSADLRDRAEPGDRHARHAVLFTDTDDPKAWLASGEALSAVLLTATIDRLAVSPVSDVMEVPANRQRLRELLGGIGYPAVVLRIGMPAAAVAAEQAARRPAAETIEEAGR